MRESYDFSDSKPNPYVVRSSEAFSQDDLWGESASRRLSAARSLKPLQVSSVQQALLAECPWKPTDLGDEGRVWPYGNATSINPLLVTLGASPGDSPPAGDSDAPSHLELPPAGLPHPHVCSYQDTTRYWDKVRYLAHTMLTPAGERTVPRLEHTDAYALFGNMNLDPRRSGSASDATIDPTFAAWVLRTIEGGLRPRWLVCLGLKGLLLKPREDPALREAFQSILKLDLNKPDKKYQLRESHYCFREWEVRTAAGASLTVVFWPNSPSRPPFQDFGKWCAACEQFKDRHASDARV